MKHTSLLINNLRAVLLAALTSGIVGTVNGQQLHPFTPTSPLPESGRFGGTGPGGTPAGVPAYDIRYVPPKKDGMDGCHKAEPRLGKFRPTREMPRSVKQAHNQAAPHPDSSPTIRETCRGDE